jgi:hypothetical protein
MPVSQLKPPASPATTSLLACGGGGNLSISSFTRSFGRCLRPCYTYGAGIRREGRYPLPFTNANYLKNHEYAPVLHTRARLLGVTPSNTTSNTFI